MWIERFWAKVKKGRGSGCWTWTGAAKGAGYGILKIEGRTVRANRLSFELKHGRSPKGHVLHTCDNPSCVRPSHLYEGDAQRNAADREERGRGNHVRGSANPRARLCDAEVRVIKALLRRGNMTQQAIADHYNIKRSAVADIKAGRSWSHVA